MTPPLMAGFSEQGELPPRDGQWPLAAGRVTGFRWWNLRVPLRPGSWYRPDEPTWYPPFPGPLTPWPYSVSAAAPSPPPWYVPPYRRRYCPPGRAGRFPELAGPAELRGMRDLPWVIPADGWSHAQCFPLPRWMTAVTGRPSAQEPCCRAPAPGCGCGFWAYWGSPPPGEFSLTTSVTDGPAGREALVPVLGVIAGAGRVIIGERGFRCAQAKVLAVALAPFPLPDRLLTESDTRAQAQVLARHLAMTADDAHAFAAGQLRSAVPGATVHASVQALLRAVAPDPHYGSPAGAQPGE